MHRARAPARNTNEQTKSIQTGGVYPEINCRNLTQRCAHSMLRSWQHCVILLSFFLFIYRFVLSLRFVCVCAVCTRSPRCECVIPRRIGRQPVPSVGSVKSKCSTSRSVATMACRRNNVSEIAVDAKPHINRLNDYKNSTNNYHHQNGIEKQLANGHSATISNGFANTMVCDCNERTVIQVRACVCDKNFFFFLSFVHSILVCEFVSLSCARSLIRWLTELLLICKIWLRGRQRDSLNVLKSYRFCVAVCNMKKKKKTKKKRKRKNQRTETLLCQPGNH